MAIERHWRTRGYVPAVIDSAQLWSQQRDRVYGDSPRPLVLLGASRTEYSVDVKALREHLPGYKPVMLTMNGRYPLATLRDLAADEDFRGTVLIDIESNGFLREFREAQQPWIDYYHRRWTPSWRLHRIALSAWQRLALIANPDFGALATLKRAFTGGEPYRNYITYRTNRASDIDFTKTDAEATKRHFAATVEANITNLPARTADEWLADLTPVFDWVRAIQGRGGAVIFYESPTSGYLREISDRLYPRDRYWDRFAAASPTPVLAARDVPALAATRLPDDSHVDFRDKATYTQKLIDTLVQRGLLKPRPD